MPSLPYKLVHRALRHEGIFSALQRFQPSHVSCNDSVVIAGSPRSGTTWLAEMIAETPGYIHIDEPLHLGNGLARRHANVSGWRHYVSPGAEGQDQLKSYLRFALQGRLQDPYSNSSVSALVRRFLFGGPAVVKFVRANRLLHWMERTFDIGAMILLLRHPCAVVASQLSYESSEWRRADLPSRGKLQSEFGGWIPTDLFRRFRDVLSGIQTHAGYLAAVWCLDNYIPLRYEDRSLPAIVTTYERLVRHRGEECARIFGQIGLKPPGTIGRQAKDPSSSAADDLYQDPHRQLSKWKRKLDDRQIETVLQVVDVFGLNFYGADVEPVYDEIRKLRKRAEASTPS